MRRLVQQGGLWVLETMGLGFQAHSRLVQALRATFAAEGFDWNGWLPWRMIVGPYQRKDWPDALICGPHWVNGSPATVDMAATQTLCHLWWQIAQHWGLRGCVAYWLQFRIWGSGLEF